MVEHNLGLVFRSAVWAGVVAVLWADCAGAAVRYGSPGFSAATPHTPMQNKYNYIPLNNNVESDDFVSQEDTPTSSWGMVPSEFILTALRTALDVVRNINKNRVATRTALIQPQKNTTAVAVRRSRPRNGTSASGRGFEDYYDEHHEHHETTTTTAKPMKQGRYTDPWAGYYDWIINEGSFKFWSVFQLFTAALLLYACFSAIYYAKFNPILPDYDREYDDYFLERSVGRKARSLESFESWELPSGLNWITPQTFQFILDAISKTYGEE